MNTEERIDALEAELRRLAEDLSANQGRMIRLFDEVRALKGEVGKETGSGASSTEVGWQSGASSQSATTPQSGAASRSGVASVSESHDATGLRLIHLVGIVVLLTGIAIGVKYAIDQELISAAARIGLAYAAGAILLILSIRLRKNYEFLSAILFSGSMACWYFTTYGALAYYHFISSPVAFILMIALTIVTVLQSISYDRMEIAIIGLVGAYGIPLLVSNNTGRIDLFFTYILLINIAVVYLGYRKDWRIVSRLAMVVTWVMLLGWEMLPGGISNGNAVGSSSTILSAVPPIRHTWLGAFFTLAYYFLFIVDSLLHGAISKKKFTDLDVLQVGVNNLALLCSGLLIVSPYAHTGEWVTLSLTIWLAVAAWLTKRFLIMDGQRRLATSLIIQAIGMATLFVAVHWTGLPVTLGWLTLGVAVFIAGMRMDASWLRKVSILLAALVLVKLITIDALLFTAVQRIISFLLTGALILGAAFYYQREKRKG